MIVIGVDVHKHTLTAVAVDEVGRPLAARAGLVAAGETLVRTRGKSDGIDAAAAAAEVDRAAQAPQPHAREVGRDRRGRGRAGSVAGAAAGRA